MTSEIDQFSLSSTYVVLGDNSEATPISVSDRFFADLEHTADFSLMKYSGNL